MMFTCKDTIAAMDQAKDEALPPLLMHHHVGHSEDDFWFFRGAKKDFRDSAHFWIVCLQYQSVEYGWTFAQLQESFQRAKKFLGENCAYEEIAPETFSSTVKNYHDSLMLLNLNKDLPARLLERLKKRYTPPDPAPDYEWEGEVYRAMRLSDEWNDVTVIGETEHEFIVCEWETSA